MTTPFEVTNPFADVQPGDELWVINSRMNSVFQADIVSVQDGLILAHIPEKDRTYSFRWADGEATDGGSFLAADDDWRVQVILTRKRHIALHQAILKAASAFKDDPTQRNATALRAATEEWITFTAECGDYDALTSVSIHEYMTARGNAGQAYRDARGVRGGQR